MSDERPIIIENNLDNSSRNTNSNRNTNTNTNLNALGQGCGGCLCMLLVVAFLWYCVHAIGGCLEKAETTLQSATRIESQPAHSAPASDEAASIAPAAPVPPHKEPAVAPAPPPYAIVDGLHMPSIDEYLVKVVVPADATEADVRKWHKEVRKQCAHQASKICINYFAGAYETDKLIAVDLGTGDLDWFGSKMP